MKKSMKYVAAALAVMMVFMLMGCGAQPNIVQSSAENDGNAENHEKEPEIITFGYIDAYSHQDLDPDINERIVSFNRGQSDYFIEIRKYGEDSYLDGLSALNTDITTGKAPDILALRDSEFLKELGEKGVLEDLYAYMDAGEWPKRKDFVVNVLPHMENDGKLYGLVPFFTISGLIANPNHISTDAFTFAQLKELYEKNQGNEEVLVYNGLNQSALMGDCIVTSLGEFVDLENKTCDFTKAEFRTLLEFAAQFETPDGAWYGDDYENYTKLLEDKMYVLYDGGIESFQKYMGYQGLMGQNGKLVGFPSVSGSKPHLSTYSSYLAINSKSGHKDAAWQFLCTFLENRYLLNSEGAAMGFPVTQNGFDMAAQRSMESSTGEAGLGNANGQFVYYQVPPATKEDVAYLQKVIAEAEQPEDYGDIPGIVWEEADSYLDGSKTVQEVIDIIQNRVQLYLDEMN